MNHALFIWQIYCLSLTALALQLHLHKQVLEQGWAAVAPKRR